MEFEISRDHQGNATIQLLGPIMEDDLTLLKDGLQKARESSGGNVYADMSSVPTISSSGIGKIISFYRNLRNEGREFEIRGIHADLFALFNSIQLNKLFPIVH